MMKLRTLHTYLGCLFGPLIIYFAISGIWQTFRLNSPRFDAATQTSSENVSLTVLSTIHTSRQLKTGLEVSSPPLTVFVIAMAIGLVVTAAIGIAMALRYGHNRPAIFGTLAAGIFVPLLLVLAKWLI